MEPEIRATPIPWNHGELPEYDPDTYELVIPAWLHPFHRAAQHINRDREQGTPEEASHSTLPAD